MWKGLCIRVSILIFVIVLFSLLYYFICSDKSNWLHRDKDLDYFESLFFTLNTITTVGNSPFTEYSVKCQMVSIFLYIIMLVGIVELIYSAISPENKASIY